MTQIRQEHSKSGLLLIISGPSGVGKSTITHHLEQELVGVFSVSVTTRPKASCEVDGKDYFFLTHEQFTNRRDEGDLLEWAEVFGNYYGTPAQPVHQALARGDLVLLEIDVKGAIQVKKKVPNAFAIFVLPPDENALLERLRRRGRDDKKTIQSRLSEARDEIERGQACGVYDTFIINDQLQQTVEKAVTLVYNAMKRSHLK